MRTLLHQNKRPLIYALVLTFGFGILVNLQHLLSSANFFTIGCLLYLLLLLELVSTRFLANRLADQYTLDLKRETGHAVHVIHHKVLPSLLYFALLFFSYFNSSAVVNFALAFFVFMTFLTIFTNIAAFYEHKFKLEKSTRNVYDLISIIIYFVIINDIWHIFAYFDFQPYAESFWSSLAFFALGLLALIRLGTDSIRHDLALLVAAIALIPVHLLLIYWDVTMLFTNLILVLYYYYFLAFAHHWAEKTASFKVLLEYFVVFLLFIVILVLGIRVN